jgi:hypothetical protein
MPFINKVFIYWTNNGVLCDSTDSLNSICFSRVESEFYFYLGQFKAFCKLEQISVRQIRIYANIQSNPLILRFVLDARDY